MAIKIEQIKGLKVPNTFIEIVSKEIAFSECFSDKAKSLTLNFKDPEYGPEAGGFHPVEVRLEKHTNNWQFEYVTDFSYQGNVYPELVKEIDICFSSKRVFHLLVGWLNHHEAKELFALFISNFVEYYRTGCYQVSITCD